MCSTDFIRVSGGPYDRGSMDAYYGRGPSPHRWEDAHTNAAPKRIPLTDPTEVAQYYLGYEEQDDRKDWG